MTDSEAKHTSAGDEINFCKSSEGSLNSDEERFMRVLEAKDPQLIENTPDNKDTLNPEFMTYREIYARMHPDFSKE